jgi:hypothetical protein
MRFAIFPLFPTPYFFCLFRYALCVPKAFIAGFAGWGIVIAQAK